MLEKGAIINVEGHIGFSITTPRLRNQFCTLPDKYHRISGDYNKFNQNRVIPLKRESSKNSYPISENIGPEISVCHGGLSSGRNIIFNSHNSTTSPSPLLLPTKTTNRQIKNFLFLHKTNSFIPSKESRDSKVNSQFEIK